MEFAISIEMQDLLRRIDEFMHAHVFPKEAAFLHQPFFAIEPELKEVRRKAKEAGFFVPQVPREEGGLGLSLSDFALVSELLGRSPLGHYLFGCQAPDAGNIEVLLRHATPEQKQRYLVPLIHGDIRSCFAMTEPDTPGSNPIRLRTRAALDGEHYVLNGRKWFTSGADGASFAIAMAVTDEKALPHKRATLFIVPTDTPGFSRLRNIPILGVAGEGYPSHSEVQFTDCRIPMENRLGAEGAGFAIAQERLGPGRIHHCMRWIGICERAFTLMCERALHRVIEHSDDGSTVETLASKQIIQTWIAESRAEIDAARLLVLRTAWRIDEADKSGHAGFHNAQTDVSLIKFHVAGVMQRVVDRAVQVHGALGITSDTVLSYFYGHERGARIYDGPDEVHKLAAARRILKDMSPQGRSASDRTVKR
jgi:alkylation response protein AidB-like acyl-CoA dehydrogenase